jgi:hypothetical protein
VRSALKVGSLTGLFVVSWVLTMFLLGKKTGRADIGEAMGALGLLIACVGTYAGLHRVHRVDRSGKMGFFGSLFFGLVLTASACLVEVPFFWAFCKFLHPDFLTRWLHKWVPTGPNLLMLQVSSVFALTVGVGLFTSFLSGLVMKPAKR